MPIISTDIQYRLSGGAANASAAASLGGIKSSNAIPTALLDDTTGAESLAGDIEYRCFYAHNNHGTLTLQNAVAWLQTQALGAGHAIAIGVGSSAVNGIEQTITTEDTPPVGITFTSPTTQGAGIALGSIPAGQHRAVWIRRTVTAASGASANSYTLRVLGDTAA